VWLEIFIELAELTECGFVDVLAGAALHQTLAKS
jgi:hypothetical protein